MVPSKWDPYELKPVPIMDERKKSGRYVRLIAQLEELLPETEDPIARMASVAAVLHHKMDHYFWTGFYLLRGDRLVAGPYQGPLACQELQKNKGVCWAAVLNRAPVVVPDVHAFPGHIACDARSKSEITLPVFDRAGHVQAVMDVDSDKPDAFSEADRINLEKIVTLIYAAPRSVYL